MLLLFIGIAVFLFNLVIILVYKVEKKLINHLQSICNCLNGLTLKTFSNENIEIVNFQSPNQIKPHILSLGQGIIQCQYIFYGLNFLNFLYHSLYQTLEKSADLFNSFRIRVIPQFQYRPYFSGIILATNLTEKNFTVDYPVMGQC